MTKKPAFNESPYESLDTLLDWVRWGATVFTEYGLFFGHGTDNAWDEAQFLCLWAIHQPWESFDRIAAAKLTLSEKKTISALYTRRINERMPSPYLTGVAWFAGYPYKVTQDVLIPRSPIAELIIKQFQPWLEKEPLSLLDMCCGSGCIGIACAHEFSEAKVDLVDISEKALVVAKQNVEFHHLEGRVDLIQSDGFSELSEKKYDVIVSNPPYVDAEDFSTMPAEFHAEPRLGLVSGDDGLDFTRRMLSQASQYLNDDGVLICEVGNSYIQLEQAFPEVGFTWPDLENGGHGVFILNKSQLAQINNS